MFNQRALSVGFDDSTTRKRRMNIAGTRGFSA
jgi:hypothetical protein